MKREKRGQMVRREGREWTHACVRVQQAGREGGGRARERGRERGRYSIGERLAACAAFSPALICSTRVLGKAAYAIALLVIRAVTSPVLQVGTVCTTISFRIAYTYCLSRAHELLGLSSERRCAMTLATTARHVANLSLRPSPGRLLQTH